ncbi:hypothetical protein LXA43DRAFT_890815 [Ganoderma leucocontextum]|nr:hypothetical protein LXA43DRAFT_890815 [Ganoderma leucocontextum]
MATTFAPSPLTSTQSTSRQQFLTPNSPPQQQRRLVSRQRFIQDFSQCLFEFVVQLLPTTEEMAVKEDVRKLLERLIRTIEPDSRLLSFGSSANGFSLKNSDMDLCCLIDSGERLNAADLVTMVGDLLERETKFHVKPLPHARIPIVKLNLDPSSALPFGIACDIGFENRLALENTRLLMCYASVDPARVRTMVLFLKVWSKRRKINSPYKGSLSSYGYVLLVIYFLVHVKNPPVLPNLQQMPPLRPISEEETHLNGYNIWFFDDIELLRQRWKSSNTDTVAELLIDFFKFYSRDFAYNTGAASIRAGLLKKEEKGWQTEQSDFGTSRERNRLCIEDPFETDFNVARCVTKDGLYTIRGEFMRASRILQMRPDRAILALAQLCEERKDETLGLPPPQPRSSFAPPRLTSIPPQTPYTVGSSPMRPSDVSVPGPEDVTSRKLSQTSSPVSPVPSSPNDSPGGRFASAKDGSLRLPADKLDHMAPIRSKWTSPPPPEAPEEDRSAFDDRLDQGLALATASLRPHLRDHSYASSNNSETHTDDERQSIAESDDVRSVKSFLEEGTMHYSREYRERERQLASLHAQQQALQQRLQQQYGIDPSLSGLTGGSPLNSRMEGGVDVKMISRLRGRPAVRVGQQPTSPSQASSGGRATPSDRTEGFTPPPRMDTPRRSMSFPVRNPNRFSLPTMPVVIPNHLAATYQTRLSPTIGHPAPRYVLQAAAEAQAQAQVNVYYETMPAHERNLHRAMAGHSSQMQLGSPQMLYDHVNSYVGELSASRSGSGSRSRSGSRSGPNPQRGSPVMIRRGTSTHEVEEPVAGPSRLPADLPAPPSPRMEYTRSERIYSHHHTHSNATVAAPTPPANMFNFPSAVSVTVPISLPMSMGTTLGPPHSHSRSRSRSPPYLPTQRNPPYPYQTTYPSPRMGATNLPPRLRADRDRSLSGQASHPGFSALPSQPILLDMCTLPKPVATGHLRTDSQVHVPVSMRAVSPFASHSSGSASPPMSCTSSQYAPSSSPLSTSPPSPARSELKGRREGEGVGVVSPLRSPIPLLDEPSSMAVAVAAPEVHAVDVFGKEKEPTTPVPVSINPVLVPAPALATPTPVLELRAKPIEAVEFAETKQDAESSEVVPPDADSLPEGLAAEVKELIFVPPPEVLVTESSPIVERTLETTVEVPEQVVAATIVEGTQGSSAGS